MNLSWDPGIFRVLGVKFSTDTGQISSLNFEGKQTEIKILKNRSRWQITPLGKITVVKTLALSTLIHVFVNRPHKNVTDKSAKAGQSAEQGNASHTGNHQGHTH